MEYRLLGPVELHDQYGTVPLGGPRGRSIPPALLLEANRVVPIEKLVAAAWGDDPPATAQIQVRNRVTRLRRLLSRTADGAQVIQTSGSGYMFRVANGQLDLQRFDRLVGQAKTLVLDGKPNEAAAALREALELWRGPALDGLRTPPLEAAARRLEETREHALERRIELDLAGGREVALTVELNAMISAHPYRERLWVYLMVALYRAGRQADALETFRQARTLFAEQLGIEPGATLQRLHEAILRADDRIVETTVFGPSAATPESVLAWRPQEPVSNPVRVPGQLPHDVFGFVGRGREIAILDSLLDALGAGEPATAGGIAVISGTAGVGKTALAVHWGHRVAGRFPDGQLYVNLGGYAPGQPVQPIDALAQFLHALGVPPAGAPPDLAEAAALYRSLLAGKRVLVVLDNARSVDQIRPLLPGSPRCLVLVASRDRLGGLVALDGAHRVGLDVLTRDEAHALLSRSLGTGRVAADAAAVDELSRICAYLPLALRIAAANLIDNPQRSTADYVAELVGQNKLAALAVDGDLEAAVQAAFDLSYRTVPPQTQRLFRLLGLVPGPDFDAGAAAALAGVSEVDAARMLDRLACAHLVYEHAYGRFTFHDLLRQYASESAVRTDADSDAATGRLFRWYLAAAERAAAMLYPDLLRVPVVDDDARSVPFTDRGGARSWLDAERANLVAACVTLAEKGPRSLAWRLAGALRRYLARHGHFTDYLTASTAGFDAANREGDEQAQAWLYHSLAHVRHSQGRQGEAIAYLRRSLELSRRSGWHEGEISAYGNLGVVYGETGRLRRAQARFEAALRLSRAAGDTVGVARIQANLGDGYRRLGRLELAAAELGEALAGYERAGASDRAVEVQDSVGAVLHLLGRFADALRHLEHGLALCRQTGDRSAEPSILVSLAAVHRDTGRHHLALEHAQAAVSLARDLGWPAKQAAALSALGQTYDRFGDHTVALDCHREAIRLAGRADRPYETAEAFVGMASNRVAAGDYSAALGFAIEAAGLAEKCHLMPLLGLALTATARARLGLRSLADAARDARRAVDIHRETGYRFAEAEALIVLATALSKMDGQEAVSPHQRAAEDVLTSLGLHP
ncbi:AfsR/SARP family transcriptional regulator [Virgisporangium aurantiacum]|uniref:SARP family transcriptional regulator n=1 Tax=Virgisporangium aurantiacum TaxID=175570 RepID=A0A8J4E6P7_9ACTN|nr:BTAD domain-containing putative transcriptional regulator [Virgisporangium aurantiacum]GIJ64315.1 SARP family transcriptional regulator [Virgisporangium aurantiacum]